MMEYVADVSRERVRFRAGGYVPSQAVESPNGSNDAFYIKIDKHYGSSDHVTYMQHGIPAVMFITWPDMWYHSSQDTPDKQDSDAVQARGGRRNRRARRPRHSGTDEMAARVLQRQSRPRAGAHGRIPHQRAWATWPTRPTRRRCADAYKEAHVADPAPGDVEKAVVESASVLWTNTAEGKSRTAPFLPLIDQRAAALLNEVERPTSWQAAQRGCPPAPVD